jgi:DNA-binding NtrC family response regulator
VPPAPAPAPGALGAAPREREIVRVEIRDPNAMPLIAANGEMRRLEDIEAAAIRFALAHYRGQMSEIARRLGIGRSTLYRKMKEYGLEEESESDSEPSGTLVA